jgi:capsular polysaccharide transport system ATP-binding protein
MIRLENVTKAYRYRGIPKYIARDVSAVIPKGAKLALMGRNGAGKSTLMSMIAGNLNPDRGRISVQGAISWPIGITGTIQGDLTGIQNVRFLGRIYGVDTDELVDFVGSFADLGMNYDEPVRTYSQGMRGRLQFGMAMGIRFDTYLIDEVTSAGDASFRKKSQRLFEDRLANAGVIFISHSDGQLREICTSAAVLEAGAITFFDDVDVALVQHRRNLQLHRPAPVAP